MTMALCLPFKPRSLNAKRGENYHTAIAKATSERFSGSPLETPLYSRIIWFHKYVSQGGDVDNIAKRIHDALKGVLFVDDGVITHSLAVRVDASEVYEIIDDPNNPDPASELLSMLARSEYRDVLYIEIGAQLDSKTRLGPIQ